MAYFAGNSLIDIPHDVNTGIQENTIRFSFRTTQAQSTILYAAGPSDFLSVSLVQGRLRLSFDAGDGTLTLSSASALNDDQWHDVVLMRQGVNARMSIDNVQNVTLAGTGTRTGINNIASLLVGNTVSRLRSSSTAYVGLLSDVEVDGVKLLAIAFNELNATVT